MVVSGVVVVSVAGVSVVCLAHAARANTMVSARSKAMIFFISEKSSIHKFYHPARFCPHLKYIPIVTGVCAFVYRILDFIFLEIFSHVKSARIILVTFHKNQQLVSHFVPVCSISAKYCIFPADFSLCAAVRVLWTSPKLLNQTKRLPSGFQS